MIVDHLINMFIVAKAIYAMVQEKEIDFLFNYSSLLELSFSHFVSIDT